MWLNDIFRAVSEPLRNNSNSASLLARRFCKGNGPHHTRALQRKPRTDLRNSAILTLKCHLHSGVRATAQILIFCITANLIPATARACRVGNSNKHPATGDGMSHEGLKTISNKQPHTNSRGCTSRVCRGGSSTGVLVGKCAEDKACQLCRPDAGLRKSEFSTCTPDHSCNRCKVSSINNG